MKKKKERKRNKKTSTTTKKNHFKTVTKCRLCYMCCRYHTVIFARLDVIAALISVLYLHIIMLYVTVHIHTFWIIVLELSSLRTFFVSSLRSMFTILFIFLSTNVIATSKADIATSNICILSQLASPKWALETWVCHVSTLF